MIAFKNLLQQNRLAGDQTAEQISALESHIDGYMGGDEELLNEMENHRVDSLHGKVYQDAAHSMSAVVMLAPFLESLLIYIFKDIEKNCDRRRIPAKNGSRGELDKRIFWDPHQFRNSDGKWKRGLACGIIQLSESTVLRGYLPDDFSKIISALMAYRNKMFHNGFEWPTKERENFSNLMHEKEWPDSWFEATRDGDHFWIYFMSNEFINLCLDLTDK